MLRRALVALSLANLCFIPAWREVLDPGPLFHCYHTKICPVGTMLAAVTLDALLLAALFFVGFELARRAGRPLLLQAAYAAFLVALIVPLNGIRVQFPSLMTANVLAPTGKAVLGIVALALVALAAFAVWRLGLARLARGAVTAVLILSPFVGIAYAQSLWRMVRYRQGIAEQAAAQPPASSPATPTRVLWLVFDELDYRVAFADRPATLRLPEFDRLRGESLFAGEAYPPAGLTIQSLPAFISGKLVADAKQVRPDDLAVKFHEEAEWVGWATRPSIFARAREQGVASAVVGWYHPYCRLFGEELVRCSWREAVFIEETILRRSRLKDSMIRDAKISFLSLPVLHRFLPRDEEAYRIRADVMPEHVTAAQRESARDYLEMMEEARQVVADPGVGLALVHLSIPHPPGFYDREQGRLSVDTRHSYLDSLALVDRAVGELRRAMEEAGTWERTAVLITGDHWWRAREQWVPQEGEQATMNWHAEDATVLPAADEYRVPFILKLPGQSEGVEYAAPFNTVLGHDLVLSVLRGETKTPGEAARWLDEHRSVGPSPYYNVLVEKMRDFKQRPWKN